MFVRILNTILDSRYYISIVGSHNPLGHLGASPDAALHRCSYEEVFWKYAANLQENTHAEVCKVAKQLYWNHTSAWLFFCKFAAYFQNILLSEHLWRATSASP